MITKGAVQGLNKTLGRRYFSSFTPAKLPDLPYGYSELEPAILGKIMELHHTKHHQAYVNGYNQAVEQALDAEAKGDVAKVVALQPLIRFNGGGHINHSIFWQNLAPKAKGGGKLPDDKSALAQAVKQQFGSFDNLKTQLNTKTLGIQGSGWGWLAYSKTTKSLVLQDQANQDPLALLGLTPLLGIDIWEHAFYLQYLNVKADYLKAIWDVVNWKDVEARYTEATK